MTVLIRVKPSTLWDEISKQLGEQFPSAEIIVSDTPDVSVQVRVRALVSYGETQESLERYPRLEALFVPMAGVNQFPLSYLHTRGIILSNAHSNGKFVAERAVALILGYFGRIVDFHQDLRNTEWHGFAIGEAVQKSWDSIFGMRVGILGIGSIGRWVARLLKPFDVQTTGFYRGGSDRDVSAFTSVTTDLVTAISDRQIVISTLPLTDSTRNLVGAEEFAHMNGALFVNVGRGEVVNQHALYDALITGVLSGAAIDTWYIYPKPGSTKQEPAEVPLHTLKNVLLSPHLGGFTTKATRSSIDDVVRNLGLFLSTGTGDDVVNTERGY